MTDTIASNLADEFRAGRTAIVVLPDLSRAQGIAAETAAALPGHRIRVWSHGPGRQVTIEHIGGPMSRIIGARNAAQSVRGTTADTILVADGTELSTDDEASIRAALATAKNPVYRTGIEVDHQPNG